MLCERPPTSNASGGFQGRILRHFDQRPGFPTRAFCGIETLLRHSGVGRERNFAPTAVVKATFSAMLTMQFPPCGTSRHDCNAAMTPRLPRVESDRGFAGGGDRHQRKLAQ